MGYHQSYSGIERVLIRPNNWYFTESAAPNQVVQSATLTIRDITVTTPEEDIEVRPFFGGTWEENYVNWTDFEAVSYGPVLDSNPVSSAIGWNEGYYYSYDITPLVQNWYTGVSNWQKGLIIRWDEDDSATSTMEKCFASSQYSNENYRPRLEVTTAALSTIESGVYELESYAAGAGYYLSAEPVAVDNYATTGAAETQPLSLDTKQTDSLHQKWRITHIQNNYYTIRPYHYTPAGLYTSGSAAVTAALGTSDLWEEVSSGFLWYIEATPLPGGGYGNCFSLYPYGSGFSLGVYNSSSSWGVYAGDGYGGTDHKWSFTEEENPAVEARLYSIKTGEYVNSNPTVNIYDDESVTLFSMGYHLSVCAPNNYSLGPTACDWAITGKNAEIQYSYGSVSFRLSGIGHAEISVYLSSSTVADYCLKVYHFNSGNYYIRNAQTKLSLQLVDDSGPSVEASILQGNASQNWELEKHEITNAQQQKEIYYTISCTVNAEKYYLSLSQSSVSDGDPVILRTSTMVTDEMLWRLYYFQIPYLDQTPSLKIAPKIEAESIDFALACEVQDNTLESSLVIKEFNGILSAQSWEMNSFASYNKQVTATIYADKIYYVDNDDYHQEITKYMEDANLFFVRNFGIFIEYSFFEGYESYADSCSNSGDSERNQCNCLDDTGKPLHHKNVYSNFDQIPTGAELEHMNIMFTKHEMCDDTCNSINSHIATGVAGLADFSAGKVLVRERSYNSTLKTLVHEICHIFGNDDHYDKNANGPNDGNSTTEEISLEKGREYSSDCIHGENKNEVFVINNLILCSGCRTEIDITLNNHFFPQGGSEG